MSKLTADNQGYWDRIKRAKSWIERARAVERQARDEDETVDLQTPFIMYWIAFNAMYGRVSDIDHGRYLRPGEDDARWFLRRISDLDAGEGRIGAALTEIEREAQRPRAICFLGATNAAPAAQTVFGRRIGGSPEAGHIGGEAELSQWSGWVTVTVQPVRGTRDGGNRARTAAVIEHLKNQLDTDESRSLV